MRDYEIMEKVSTLKPEHAGFSTPEEVNLIKVVFGLNTMTCTELLDFRNQVVTTFCPVISYLRFNQSKPVNPVYKFGEMEAHDKMSAITGTIDHILHNMGVGV